MEVKPPIWHICVLAIQDIDISIKNVRSLTVFVLKEMLKSERRRFEAYYRKRVVQLKYDDKVYKA